MVIAIKEEQGKCSRGLHYSMTTIETKEDLDKFSTVRLGWVVVNIKILNVRRYLFESLKDCNQHELKSFYMYPQVY